MSNPSEAQAGESGTLDALAARLFLADPDRPGLGPWASLPEGHQRPYLSMAQAAVDHRPATAAEPTYTLTEAKRELAARACRAEGHIWEFGVRRYTEAHPGTIYCSRCGWTGDVTMDGEQP